MPYSYSQDLHINSATQVFTLLTIIYYIHFEDEAYGLEIQVTCPT